jgi:H2-forming N5,N10-methylenetetrahydromethanopterin dehydrogenase-like enzyme
MRNNMAKYCGKAAYKFRKALVQVLMFSSALHGFAHIMYAVLGSSRTYTQVIRCRCSLVCTQVLTSVNTALSAVSTPPIITTTNDVSKKILMIVRST